jgi:hypothetical protein
VAGTGSARITAFLFDSFFFVPCTVKEKAAMEHCESERRSIMTIKVTNRPSDAKEICFSVAKRFTVINVSLIILLTIAGLLPVFVGTDATSRVEGLGFVIFALILLLAYRWKMRRFIKQYKDSALQICAQTPIQYLTFDERIISERFVDDEIVGKTILEYSAIQKAWETKNLILIHTRGGQILVLPKCDLTEAEQTDVKRLLVTVGVPCRFKKS